MSAAVSAQDAFETGNEALDLKTLKVEQLIKALPKADSQVAQEIGDFDLASLKDVSFATENGALANFDAAAGGGNRIVGILLAIFLGDFGIHHFYTGDTKHGLIHLLFCWTGIPGLIGLIEGIIWIIDEGSYGSPLINI
ncbi:MAG: TM2 domain-containing protein [Bacteroidales bacterium]|nr:TM2 domain-containing protein [Bacteroidales bacterium]